MKQILTLWKHVGFLSDISMRRTCQSVPGKALGFMETNGKKILIQVLQ